MSSEERVVRPYVGVDRLQKVLNGFSLQAGNDVLANGEKLTLSPLDYLTCPVSIALAGDGAPLADVRQQLLDGIDELGIDRADAELLILVSTDRLKLSEIIWRRSLDQLDMLEPVVTIATGAARPDALEAPFGGCRVDTYLVLARSLEPVVLRPWRKGTWIGRVAFNLSTELGEIGFTPLPLDDDARERLHVAQDTNRVVRLEESVVDPEVTDDALELYVDSELLAQLTRFPSTPGSRAFQAQLFLEAATAIVIQAIRMPELHDFGAEELKGSLLGKLIARVAGRRAGEAEDAPRQRRAALLGQLKNDPLLFIAALEAVCKTKTDLSSSIMTGVST